MAEKSTKGRSGSRHSALGRGLGALIPNQTDGADSPAPQSSDPLDVFFPGQPSLSGGRERGGSARDLLSPSTQRRSAQKKSSRSRSGASKSSDAPRVVSKGSSSKGDVAEVRARIPDEPKSATPNESADASAPSSDVSRETLNELLPVPGASFAELEIEYVVPNTRQPREVFDEEELAELAASIAEVGVLQPIIVRPINADAEPNARMQEALQAKPNARYELIMGERRLRASEAAGLTSVPAIIKDTDDSDLLRDALLENLHRAQLNPLEEASAYEQLMADFGATQEQLSKKIARSRPQIANTLRLLKLPPSVQKMVAAQVISAGHARALLGLGTTEEMETLAQRIIAEGISVRTTEEIVRLGRVKNVSRQRTRRSQIVSPLGEQVVSAMQDFYDTRVTITEGVKKGKIVIEFAGAEDLQRIADIMTRK